MASSPSEPPDNVTTNLISEQKCLFVLYCIVLYCIVFVLMGWSLLPNALRPFQIYCAPLNLGITRTWILNFAQKPIISGLRFCNEPEISDSGHPGLVLRISTSWKKSIELSWVEPTNLGSRGEHVTPRPPKPKMSYNYNSVVKLLFNWIDISEWCTYLEFSASVYSNYHQT